MSRMQDVIDFVMRNRKPIGATIAFVGIALHAVPMDSCVWCLRVAEFCAVAGAYISGTGADSSDKRSEIKQEIRDGVRLDRRSE